MHAPTIRPPAVAGSFYPADPDELKLQVNEFLRKIAPDDQKTPPKAIIAPHAGYIYSGPIAASVYARLQPWHDVIKRVILIGPAHRVPVEGLVTSSADCFATPLGEIPLDRDAIEQLLSLAQVDTLDEAHRQEHSIEVHLPFLQEILDDFTLVPLVFGRTQVDSIGEVLETFLNDRETLLVVSSDLSHFQDYSKASEMDQRAADAIYKLKPNELASDQACGQKAIQALLVTAKRHAFQPKLLDLRNSGDTAGTKDRVVGYGAFEFR